MKANIKIVAFIAAIIILAGTIIFVGCKKEDLVKQNNTEKVEKGRKCNAYSIDDIIDDINVEYVYLDRNTINNISKEVAKCHDYMIRMLLNSSDVDYWRLNDDFIEWVYDMEIEEMSNYPFENGEYFQQTNNKINISTLQQIVYDIISMDNFSSEILSSYISTIYLNTENTDSWIEEISNTFEECLSNSITYEEFVGTYSMNVDNITNTIENDIEYMCVRFYADMQIGSFQTWCDYLYGEVSIDMDTPKNTKSWWNKIKATAQEVWQDVKPVVIADAGGAVTGAMVGAAVGGVGAAPGAVITSVATSAGAATVELANRILK